jgi:hypothetical protein
VAGEASDATERAKAIWRDGLDIWLSEGKRLHERSTTSRRWRPEDLISDTTDVMEHMTSVVERSLALGLELLRPWAQQYQRRAGGGASAAAEAGEATDA